MKKLPMAKPMWIGAIVLSIMTMPLTLSASAQTPTEPAPGTAPTTTEPAPTTTVAEDDDGFDWGLLGLLGLLGLAGLTRRRDDRTYYRDPNVDPTTTTTTHSDYR